MWVLTGSVPICWVAYSSPLLVVYLAVPTSLSISTIIYVNGIFAVCDSTFPLVLGIDEAVEAPALSEAVPEYRWTCEFKDESWGWMGISEHSLLTSSIRFPFSFDSSVTVCE